MLNSLGFPKPPSETRVVVAMSGGVDSSVVAGLLAREGYGVVGITLQLYDSGPAMARAGSCCAGVDIADARAACDRLGVPHYVLDYEQRFREAVIGPFAAAYAMGETPVPCVSCNQTVKFADLVEVARDLGADCLATGHYIRSAPRPNGSGRLLLRPADAARDQSWFLFATTQEQVDYLRFPLGDLRKDEVRALADEMGLGVAAKPDSQDICFVPRGSYAEIVSAIRPDASLAGDILHLDGRVLGRHEGISRFTIGQRRGIGVSTEEPIYVVHLDARSRTVIVGPRDALGVRAVRLRDMNWLGDDTLAAADGMALFAKVRSTRSPVPARLSVTDDYVSVAFAEGEAGVSPGQACVLYDRAEGEANAQVLGGGFIAVTERDPQIDTRITALLTPRAAAA